MKHLKITTKKRKREPNNDNGSNTENYIITKKIKINETIDSVKTYKPIFEIKTKIINQYLALSEEEKNDNNILLKLVSYFDINEDINTNILLNDINAINLSEKNSPNNNIEEKINVFIEHYQKFRYTISTPERKRILNLVNGLITERKSEQININYELKSPKELLQNFLLNLIKEKTNDINIEEYRKRSELIDTFFGTFPINKGKIIKNQLIFVRKRGSYECQKGGVIFSRNLRRSRNELFNSSYFRFRDYYKKKE